MLLFTVPGFTVTVVVAVGAVPVSRTVIVTVVSTRTGLGVTVSAEPLMDPDAAMIAWLLELTM